jgi:phospholipase D1/2
MDELNYASHHSSFLGHNGISAKWLFNGSEYFAELANYIRKAEYEILIGGWHVAPDVVLERTPEGESLYEILKKQHESHSKLRTYVLLWQPPSWGFPSFHLDYTVEKLQSIAGVTVCTHKGASICWSHHQKIVVIDEQVAFIGGLDLTFNRWDNGSGCITDSPFWRHKDVYNPLSETIFGTGFDRPDQPYPNMHDFPRMPWHDVQILLGKPKSFVIDSISWCCC